MKYKHILFDLDGTLTDPMLGITNSVIYALKHYGFSIPDRSEIYHFIGPPLVDSFMDYCNFDRKKAEEAVEVYREYFGEHGIFENTVYEGMDELLSSLVDGGAPLYLATSKPEYYATQILEHFDLLKYFTFVAGNTMAESRSEKADVISYLFENFPEANGDATVMVGDTQFDIAGARAHNLDSIALLYGYGDLEKMRALNPTYFASSVNELKNILL